MTAMPPIIIRKPRVKVHAGIPVRQLYATIHDTLAAWSDQQADAFTTDLAYAFASDAAYAITRDELLEKARQYVDLIELPSA